MIGNKIKLHLSQGYRLKKRGDIELDKLLKEIRAWARKYNYTFQEKDHTDKLEQRGHEIILKWTLERKATEHINNEITLVFFLREINKTKGGKESGLIQIDFTAFLNLDYENKWQHTKFLKFISFIYNNYIIKPQVEKNKGKLFEEVKELRNLTKSYLELNQ